MRNGLLITLLLLNGSPSPSQPFAAFKSLSVNCPAVKPVALAYFEDHQFQVAPDTRCSECFHLKTTHLRDADNHKLFSSNAVIHKYMDTSKDGRDVFGSWYVHSGMSIAGDLRLYPESGGCKAQLLFKYSWYATEFLVAIPVDGDPASRPSNLRLEHEYLNAVAKHFAEHSSPPLKSLARD